MPTIANHGHFYFLFTTHTKSEYFHFVFSRINEICCSLTPIMFFRPSLFCFRPHSDPPIPILPPPPPPPPHQTGAHHSELALAQHAAREAAHAASEAQRQRDAWRTGTRVRRVTCRKMREGQSYCIATNSWRNMC